MDSRSNSLTLLLLFAGTACSSSSERGEPDPRARGFLGSEAVEILAESERIESYCVRRELGNAPLPDGALAGLLVLSRGPALDSAQRELVKALLFDEDSYEFEMAKGCEPTPGVLLRAYRGERFVDIALCFECKMWGIGVQSSREHFPRQWEDFDPVTKPLVGLVKKLFPADAVIQGLR